MGLHEKPDPVASLASRLDGLVRREHELSGGCLVTWHDRDAGESDPPVAVGLFTRSGAQLSAGNSRFEDDAAWRLFRCGRFGDPPGEHRLWPDAPGGRGDPAGSPVSPRNPLSTWLRQDDEPELGAIEEEPPPPYPEPTDVTDTADLDGRDR